MKNRHLDGMAAVRSLRMVPALPLRRVIAWGVALTLAFFTLWASPLSPFGVGRGDALLGFGRPDLAVIQYDAVARLNPSIEIRRLALYRSSLVWSVDLADPYQARRRLIDLIGLDPPGPLAASAHEQLGQLHLEIGNIDLAADAFQMAWQLDPDAPEAAERLMLAARSRVDEGNLDAAQTLWEKIGRRYPEHRPLSLVSQAEILLGAGKTNGALALYEQAISVAHDPSLEAVARLGAATCMERLGEVEEAIAELDVADLPEAVLEARREGLRNRRVPEESL